PYGRILSNRRGAAPALDIRHLTFDIGAQRPVNTSLKNTWDGLSLGQRAALGAVLAVVFAGILLVATTASRPAYGVLFASLKADDAAAVTSKLRDMKVEYRLSQGGQTIEVPEARALDLRLSMTAAGLPRGGTGG